MRIKNIFKKLMAFGLTLAMLVQPMPAFAANDEDIEASALEGLEAKDMNINISWQENKYKQEDETTLSIDEPNDTSNVVKLRVSYNCQEIRAEGFAPGELVIVVKGIGKVGRGTTIEAQVAADKQNSSVKTRDWSYTYDSKNDLYTLTNNEEIKPFSVLSGYFDMSYNLPARECTDGYVQDDIFAKFMLPDGSMKVSEKLTFTNDTLCDVESVGIALQQVYGPDGLNYGNLEPNDYIFVKYNFAKSTINNSRGEIEKYYVFDPDEYDVGNGEYVVINDGTSAIPLGNGTYRTNATSLYVAYPRNSYEGKDVDGSIRVFASYYDGDDNGSTEALERDSDIATFNISSGYKYPTYDIDYDPTNPSGDIYNFEKIFKLRNVNANSFIGGYKTTMYLIGIFNIPSGITFDALMVDDMQYIRQEDGTYRQLMPGEYNYTSITVPSISNLINYNGYSFNIKDNNIPYEIYIGQNGADVNLEEAPWYSGKLSTLPITFNLPDNVTALAVKVYGLAGLKYSTLSFPVGVNYNVENVEALNLLAGVVLNTAYMVLTDQNGREWTYSRYDIPEEIDQKAYDNEHYGREFFRRWDYLKFYVPEEQPEELVYVDFSDFYSVTELKDITYDGATSKFMTDVTINGSVHISEDDSETDTAEKFSLYTILPEMVYLDGYTVPEDCYDLFKISGIAGKGMMNDEMQEYVSYEIIQDYQGSGRDYIALHFDFSSLEEKPLTSSVSVTFPVRILKQVIQETSGSVFIRSLLLPDQPMNAIWKVKTQDNSDYEEGLWADIDRDGDTDERYALSSASKSYIYLDSSQLQLNKSIRTTATDNEFVYVGEPLAEFGSTYTYRFFIKNGSSLSKDIVVTDILETGPDMQWQGTFKSVDVTKARSMGFNPVVYYASTDSPTESDWVTEMEPALVKAVKVDFGDKILEDGKILSFFINMTAPSDPALKNKITENGYTCSFTMYDKDTGNETKADNLTSNLVRATLVPPIFNLIVTKQDAESGAKLPEAAFTLIDDVTGETYEDDANSKGIMIFKNLTSEHTYTLSETTTPFGYVTVEDQTISSTGDDVRITVNDPRLPAKLKITKVSDMNASTLLEGAKFKIVCEDGTEIEKITDENGEINLENLGWKKYTITEIEAPVGYSLDEEPQELVLTKNETAEAANLVFTDRQDDTLITVKKYEAMTDGTRTETALSNAVFQLYRASDNFMLGTFISDENGNIEITSRLPYGDYYLKESRAPGGYLKTDEQFDFTLSATNKEASVIAYNNRRPGTVTVKKVSDQGDNVNGAEYTLYDSNNVAVGSYTTDVYGLFTIDGLEWGTYTLKETKVPRGFYKDTEDHVITVNANNIRLSVDITEITKKGIATLTKLDDETKTIPLEGAVYSLYKNDGTLVQEGLTTDANGQISVSNLLWGSYYFAETKAPVGYTVSDSVIRFSVNSDNAGVTQKLYAYDKADLKSVKVTKKIHKDEINFANGDPIFTFVLSGIDVNGTAHKYTKTVRFVEAMETDENGYYSLSVTFGDLIPGEYTASEKDVMRYYLYAVTDIIGGAESNVEGTLAPVFDLVSNDEGSAVFENKRFEQQMFSETDTKINMIMEKARIVAFNVEWMGAEEVGPFTELNKNDVEAVVYYDDGTSEILGNDDYTLDTATFPGQSGDITVVGTCTRDGITLTDDFTVTVGKLKAGTVIYNANGGYFDGDTNFNQNVVLYADELTTKTKYSHSANISDDGTRSGYYTNNLRTIDVVKIPDAENLTIDLKYGTQYNYDVIYVWEGEYTGTISAHNGEYGQRAKYEGYTNNPNTIHFVVSGDTVTFGFYTNTSGTYWGYHATITGESLDIVSGTYHIPEKTGYIFEGWYTDQACTPGNEFSLNDTVEMDEGVVVFAKYRKARAVFDEGQAINKAMKIAAGNNNYSTYSTSDTKITAFVRAENMNTANSSSIVRADSSRSDIPIYMWFDNGTIYWYSEAEEVYLNDRADYMFANMRKLTNVSGLQNLKAGSSLSYLFYYCTALSDLTNLSDLDVSNVKNLSNMFFSCSGITNLHGLEDWVTSSFEDMNSMFASCSSLNNIEALADWDVSNVTTLFDLFFDCKNLQSLHGLENWSTGSVEDMCSTFFSCPNLTDISALSGWDTGNVTNMSLLFSSDTKLNDFSPISSWSTGRVQNMSAMFSSSGIKTTQDISTWDTSSVTNMKQMFSSCSSLTDITQNWDTSKVTDMSGMFANCRALGDLTPLGSWNTGNVTTMQAMFSGNGTQVSNDIPTSSETSTNRAYGVLSSLSGLENWDTSKVTDMSGMFQYQKMLSDVSAISNWDMSKVTTIQSMFINNPALTVAPELHTSTSLKTMKYLFAKCTNLSDISGLSYLNTSNVTNLDSCFFMCQKLTDLSSLSSWDVKKVTSMNYLFQSCSSLESLDGLQSWQTDALMYLSTTFSMCYNLNDISALSGWNTSNVTRMSSAFVNCRALSDLSPLSGWNTGKVTDMSSMFSGCLALIDLSPLAGWNTGRVTTMRTMFNGCSSLYDVSPLASWNTNLVTTIVNMFGNTGVYDATALSSWTLPKCPASSGSSNGRVHNSNGAFRNTPITQSGYPSWYSN